MDAFQLAGVARAPWIDPGELEKRFIDLSSASHPDRFGTSEEKKSAEQRFSEVNEACQILRSPKARLNHLLQLETGTKAPHVQEIPPEAMDLFPEVAALTRSLEDFFSQSAFSNSPMVRVQQFEKGLEWTEKVQELQQRIGKKIKALEEETRRLNPLWEAAPGIGDPTRTAALPLTRLRAIASAIGFLEKWNAQMSEKLSRLAGI